MRVRPGSFCRCSIVALTFWLASCMLAAHAQTAPDDPALVAHWPLDEEQGTVARDASGHGHDGELRGTGEWVPGKIGGALKFNGQDTSAVVPHIPEL